MRLSLLLCASALALAGCGISTPLGGTWVSAAAIPGAGFDLTLVETGLHVSGTGHQRVEAGPTRDFSVDGQISGSHFIATFYFDADGSTADYDATVDGDSLRGQLLEGNVRTELDLTRQ